MTKFPADARLRKVISSLERLGFQLIREGNHIAMLRQNPDGSRTPLSGCSRIATAANFKHLLLAVSVVSLPNLASPQSAEPQALIKER